MTLTKTSIELLAPARNLSTAREAILHGADAVYIGAPRFGARAAAGNSLDDIRQLVEFAHLYGVRIYVTLNTILYDEELQEAHDLAWQLYEIGVDALIVQDMAFLKMDLPPIPLHASTQMDNRTAEKVAWLRSLGFQQAVLARELTLDEISDIHRRVPDMPLEVFVHGATCVSYNGQCYASQHCFGRSANRGECAQFCRLPFDLIDAEGRVVQDARTGQPVRQRHLLSLHDMNRADDLEALLDAGAVSLKIEGRLKDEAYVKNVTAYYSRRLNDIISRRPDDYQRASVGESKVTFNPQLDRTFNRGFSDYFLRGRTRDMVQQCSPKSMGQPVGVVKEIRRNCFTVSGMVPFSNGDGLCFVNAQGALQGFRVNRAETNCLYPKEMPAGLKPRTPLYRNYDQEFLLQLAHPTAQRRIPVRWHLSDAQPGYIEVTLIAIDGIEVSDSFAIELQPARSSQLENLQRQFSRLGDTPFVSDGVEVAFSADWFIPSSILADWRRQMVEKLINERLKQYAAAALAASHPLPKVPATRPAFIGHTLQYNANVSNRLSRSFYQELGVTDIQPALETSSAQSVRVLMTLRYCPKHELGLCGVPTSQLSLRSADGRVFPLHFNCKQCLVQVLSNQNQ